MYSRGHCSVHRSGNFPFPFGVTIGPCANNRSSYKSRVTASRQLELLI